MVYKRVIVFGAHADDEIHMGPTIAKLAHQGTAVTVVTCTNGNEGYPSPEMRETIVASRRAEAEACDRVLGVAERIILDVEDMALTCDKPTLHHLIRIIRRVRPQAAFTHGPTDRHRDHVATSALSRQALWHAGEPVSAALGPPWRTGMIYFYKGVTELLPVVEIDVSDTYHVQAEALATQVSQHALFGKTTGQFLAEAEEIKASRPRHVNRFWLAPEVVLTGFLKVP